MNINDIENNHSFCIRVTTKEEFNKLVPFMRGKSAFAVEELECPYFIGDAVNVHGSIGMGYSLDSRSVQGVERTVIDFKDVIFNKNKEQNL